MTTLLREMNKNLAEVSTLDALTNVSNRRRLDEYLEQEWRRAKRSQEPFSFALADIDYFKNYNDEYGHQAGDRCLQRIAEALKNSMTRLPIF
jgi:diguanylate cyclase (GGDEF)-like protein